MGSHRVTYNPAETASPALPRPVLDLSTNYRTVCVANRLELRSVTCDNAQLHGSLSIGSMLDTAQCLETTATVLQMTT